MQPTTEHARERLGARVREHLQRVERRVARLRRLNVQTLALSLVFSTIATLLAGLTAASGPLVGEGPPAWRWSCALIALVTAAATFTTGIQQRFKVPEQLARALACAGQLRSLDLGLELARLAPDAAGAEYEQLLVSYPEELT
jgi:hypothetical protein